jgi:hypothetical protein
MLRKTAGYRAATWKAATSWSERGAVGDGRPDRLPEFVTGFLWDSVDVIVTTSTRETQAAKQATSTILIVMTLSPDPVGQGLTGLPIPVILS